MEAKRFYRNHNYLNNKKAQALLELMVFGSIIIGLLGVLISYGLRYNYQQREYQRSFRKALVASRDPNYPVSFVTVKDTHIPATGSQFGMGTVTPIMSTAGVTRDYELQKSGLPDNLNDEAHTPNINDTSFLPRMIIEINGQRHTYYTAGYRLAYDVSEKLDKKYNMIYGGSAIHKYARACVKRDDQPYSGGWTYLDQDTFQWEDEDEDCQEWKYHMLIIDSSEGQIMDYNTASRQCRMLTNQADCVTMCQREYMLDRDNIGKCGEKCAEPTPANQIPWYCQGNKLNSLFKMGEGVTKPKDMGLQQDYVQDTNTYGNVSVKQESPAAISTKDTIDWRVTTNRAISYRPYGDQSGTTAETSDISSVSQNKTINWETSR